MSDDATPEAPPSPPLDDDAESYVELEDWQIEHIKEALAEEGPGIPHDEVVRWMASWGTANKLPRPEPKEK